MRTFVLFFYVAFSIGFCSAYTSPAKVSGIAGALVFGVIAVVTTPPMIGHDVATILKRQAGEISTPSARP